MSVAPFAGAWIEIKKASESVDKLGSLRSPERGLKSLGIHKCLQRDTSLRSPERGLK